MANDTQFHLEDAIIPTLFGNNVLNLSTKTNRFVQSGIETPDPALGAQLLLPGETITLPFTNDLEGNPEAWTDDSDISVSGLTTGVQKAFRMRQAKAFGYTDIAQLVSVSDPANAIASRFASWWARVDQRTLLSVLKGVFANTDIATAKLYDDSSNEFSASGFLAAISRLGDLQDQTFNKIAVHSAVYAEMKKQQMIDTVQPAGAVTPFGTYNGMTIVVDDDLPLENGVATSYIFGNGSVGYSVVNPANGVEIEREARKDGGRTNIINRRVSTTHVLGTSVAKDFAPAGQTVVQSELELGTTWASVVDPRNIKVVAYKAKIDPMFVPAAPATGSTTGSGSASK